MTTAEKIVRVLNEAFSTDPRAIFALINVRIPVNLALAKHPGILCDTLHTSRAYPSIAVTGLLNGVAALDGDVIELCVDETTQMPLGFRVRPKGDQPSSPFELPPKLRLAPTSFTLKDEVVANLDYLASLLHPVLGESPTKEGFEQVRKTHAFFLPRRWQQDSLWMHSLESMLVIEAREDWRTCVQENAWEKYTFRIMGFPLHWADQGQAEFRPIKTAETHDDIVHHS
jgi:hypothetical protein